MSISRRQFLSNVIVTPIAASLALGSARPFHISVADPPLYGPEWQAAKDALDEWVRKYTGMHFTGFKCGHDTEQLAGQFLWMAVATFRSGRKATIFYYVTMVIGPTEVWHPQHLAPHVDNCMATVQRMKDQFQRDGTICTVHHLRRRAAGIEFYPYDGSCPQYNPDPRTMEERFQAIKRKVDRKDARRRSNTTSQQG